jgi:hypothetical protein
MQKMFFPIGFLVHSTLHFVPFPQLFSQTLNFHLTLVPLDHFLFLISFECLMASHKTLDFDGKVSHYTKSCRVSVSSKAQLLNDETNMKTLQKQITKSCQNTMKTKQGAIYIHEISLTIAVAALMFE